MAACPIVATSRGGAIVAVGLLVLAPLSLLTIQWLDGLGQKHKGRGQAGTSLLLLFSLLALGLGFGLGWKAIRPRLAQMDEGYAEREKLYNDAKPMATNSPAFGTGPGTFGTVARLYQGPRKGLAGATAQRLVGDAHHLRVGLDASSDWRF